MNLASVGIFFTSCPITKNFKLTHYRKDSWFYNFGDGWGANILGEVIDRSEATKRRKNSKGFSGYEWMVQSIIFYGAILTENQRKSMLQEAKPEGDFGGR